MRKSPANGIIACHVKQSIGQCREDAVAGDGGGGRRQRQRRRQAAIAGWLSYRTARSFRFWRRCLRAAGSCRIPRGYSERSCEGLRGAQGDSSRHDSLVLVPSRRNPTPTARASLRRRSCQAATMLWLLSASCPGPGGPVARRRRRRCLPGAPPPLPKPDPGSPAGRRPSSADVMASRSHRLTTARCEQEHELRPASIATPEGSA